MVQINLSMESLANSLRKRQLNEFDANIIVDGPRGNGKSTFLWKLFRSMGNFRPKSDIVFSREDVMKSLKQKRYGYIFADEMINSAHNRDFYSGDQKELIKMLNMYRDNYNVLAGAVPFFYDIDPQVRKFIKMRATIITRGVAVIQLSRPSMYSNDPWETDANKKIELSWLKAKNAGKNIKPNYTKLTTFAGYLYYGKLGKREEILYKKIKEEKRNRLMEQGTDEEKTNKDEYKHLYEHLIAGKLDESHLVTFGLGRGIKLKFVKERLRDMLKQNMKGRIINYLKPVPSVKVSKL